jgi:hypothetical protein
MSPRPPSARRAIPHRPRNLLVVGADSFVGAPMKAMLVRWMRSESFQYLLGCLMLGFSNLSFQYVQQICGLSHPAHRVSRKGVEVIYSVVLGFPDVLDLLKVG